MMKVVVENLTGTLFSIEVSNDATVEDLKREIENQQKLPSDRFVFILDTDERTVITKEEEKVSLLDYGIQDGSRIYLFFTPLDDDSTENFRLTYLDFDDIG
ncbi:hypothetical protein PHAVU_011G105800 [Phaseolus vulgaris]|uniref:Ubiquitin-like domain-containing protein n=1 Tax=Phaseolus vulgaris TaxID=3885 RepID=V7AG21_PHAVU|nr:hypothetical protein PHAVU_011G105800g [Phaseolus vulgaris]ESW04562.1 hypothetical protein PHAVU_011G105800g [Phaseolus vulgaris]